MAMDIKLARIDDRLLHGQVATVWTKETGVSRIVVVSDTVAEDGLRKSLITQAAPPGVKASVVGVDKMVRVFNNPKYDGEKTMLLFTGPEDVQRLIEAGVPISEVNIGGMSFGKGKTQITDAISVDDADVKSFDWLNDHGVKLEVRKVASDKSQDMMKLLNDKGLK